MYPDEYYDLTNNFSDSSFRNRFETDYSDKSSRRDNIMMRARHFCAKKKN